MNQLDNKFPNTYEINDRLASLYSIIGYNQNDEDSKQTSIANLQISMNFAMKAYKISPSLNNLQRWEARLGFIRAVYLYSLQDEEIHTFYMNGQKSLLNTLNLLR